MFLTWGPAQPPEFVWNVAPVWGESSSGLHYFLKGFCNLRRSSPSDLVHSPHCLVEETETHKRGGSSPEAQGEHVEGSGILMWTSGPHGFLASASSKWRP